jgi:hypothetical protein
MVWAAEDVETPLPPHLADGQGIEMEAHEMGLTGMVFSTIAIAAGAVMYWAITTTQGHGFRLSTVGVILMIVGAVGLAVSAAVFASSRRATGGGHRSYDREVTDTQGRTAAVHEEVH